MQRHRARFRDANLSTAYIAVTAISSALLPSPTELLNSPSLSSSDMFRRPPRIALPDRAQPALLPIPLFRLRSLELDQAPLANDVGELCAVATPMRLLFHMAAVVFELGDVAHCFWIEIVFAVMGICGYVSVRKEPQLHFLYMALPECPALCCGKAVGTRQGDTAWCLVGIANNGDELLKYMIEVFFHPIRNSKQRCSWCEIGASD
jgi:hypothetical protein